MYRSLLAVLLLGAGACGAATAPTTTQSLPSTTVGEVAAPAVATTLAELSPCDPAPFVPTHLPDRVAEERPEAATSFVDRFTAIPGTSVGIWADQAGRPVLALVRGALPPERWQQQPEVIEVRDFRAALGPLSEGVWAVAWFEGPGRCDDYSLFLYPPTGPEEVRTVAASLVGG
ncbi:MAG: hypothetical protein ACRDWX_01090 [Acidimicrobiia bacterium]